MFSSLRFRRLRSFCGGWKCATITAGVKASDKLLHPSRLFADHLDGISNIAAYVFFPLTILPKLYSLTYLVILLCTPPPRAFQPDQFATTATTEPTATPSTVVPTFLGSKALASLPFSQSSSPRSVHSELTASDSARSTFKSRLASADDSGFAGSAKGRSVRSLPRFGFSISPWSHKTSRGSVGEDMAGQLSSGVMSELDYYRSYAAALEASRSCRPQPSPQDVPSLVPTIEHPYAQSATAAEVPPTPITAESASTCSAGGARSVSTVVSFEIEQDLSGDSFGTLQVSWCAARCPQVKLHRCVD